MTSEDEPYPKQGFPKDITLFRVCQLLVKLFRNHEEEKRWWADTRIFNYIILEKDYVYYGTSKAAEDLSNPYHEHVVPRKVLRDECHRLIQEGNLSDDEIASLLMKHWKIVGITKEEQGKVDGVHKQDMPDIEKGKKWSFEEGDTFARYNHEEVNIEIVPKV